MTEDELIQATDWPKRSEDATADALILHGARIAMCWQSETRTLMARAFDIDREAPEYRPAMRAYVDAVTAMLAEAQVVMALVEVQKQSREQADELARVLFDMTEDGGVVGELMWEYLDARGVDADAVWAMAEASTRAEHQDPEPDDAEREETR